MRGSENHLSSAAFTTMMLIAVKLVPMSTAMDNPTKAERAPSRAKPAERVLLEPPGPVSLSKRCSESRFSTSLISRSRPTRSVSCKGRLLSRGRPETGVPGNSTTEPSSPVVSFGVGCGVSGISVASEGSTSPVAGIVAARGRYLKEPVLLSCAPKFLELRNDEVRRLRLMRISPYLSVMRYQ
jgi:hypothetical protein